MKLFQILLLLMIVLNNVIAQNLCCPPGQYIMSEDNVCWDPKGNRTTPLLPKCELIAMDQFKIYEDKQLTFPTLRGESDKVAPDFYCVGNDTTIADLTQYHYIAMVCADDPPILDEAILGYCRIASVVFLVITLAVYAALPELRDAQGKSIVNFCTSLTLGQGILAIMNIMEYSDMTLCSVRGFLAYFFMMAVFFWSNAISIQILLCTRKPHHGYDYSWKTFKWYMLYAWGCPIVLTTFVALINFLPGDHMRPGIGHMHCWFYDNEQTWYYFYSVLTFLMAINIGIFAYITIGLCRLSIKSNHVRAVKYKFIMSVRLILLMGLPWVFDMLESLSSAHIFWTIANVFNALQGVMIFLVLVIFRRRVLKLMYHRHWLDCMSGFMERHLAVYDDEEDVVQHTELPVDRI